jgi:hypothetical protein
MSEIAANLFLYVEAGIIKSLGAVPHNVSGRDDEVVQFLQSRVAVDSGSAPRYSLPVAQIKASLGIDATQGLPMDAFSYLGRTGNALRLFEGPLQNIKAPQNPLVCITPIVDGKPRIDLISNVEPQKSPKTLSEEFDGIVRRTDYLAAYLTPAGFDVHSLLADDFTSAIKLLFLHRHFVSAMKLIVSFLDTVAYLDLGDSQGNYEAWLAKYAPLAPVGVTASELWEFRNALLHMTNPLSRKVLSGKVPPLSFYIDSGSKSVRIDGDTGTKMFSLETLYDAIIEAVDAWVKTYSGNLPKQLEFIERYDTVLSEGRVAKLMPEPPGTAAS